MRSAAGWPRRTCSCNAPLRIRCSVPARCGSACSRPAQVAVEQRDLGETFDRVAADFAALNLNPSMLHLHLRPIYVSLAYGRIEQASAPPSRSTAVLDAARHAVASPRVTSVHDMVAHPGGEAWLRHLAGDAAARWPRWPPATGAAPGRHPIGQYEAARLRAQALPRRVERRGDRRGRAAGSLAGAYGWPHREDWLRVDSRRRVPTSGQRIRATHEPRHP